MEHYFYDIESYPNFFSVTYIPYQVNQALVDAYVNCDIARTLAIQNNQDVTQILKDKQELIQAMGVQQFVVYDAFDGGNHINDLFKLLEFHRPEKTLWGYNSNNYDRVILNWILHHGQNYQIYDLCADKHNIRFNETLNHYSNECIKFGIGYERTQLWIRHYKRRFIDKDLMKILYLDKTFVGLKAVAITLNWYRIQDLPYEPDHRVTTDEVPVILDYNLNDVLITLTLARKVKDEINLRYELSNQFQIDLTNLSRSSIGKALFIKYYEFMSGKPRRLWIDGRTNRSRIKLGDIIDSRIRFKTPVLNDLLSKLMSKTIHISDELNEVVLINGKGYQVAKGGLHSIDMAGSYSSDDTYVLADFDVSSMYPSGILLFNVYPAHLQRSAFLATVDYITTERLSAKKLGKTDKSAKIKAEGLKIAINRIYGALRDELDPCYDPKCTYQVTINGQLCLLMLLESLTLNGFEVISANTDGLTVKIKRTEYSKCLEICHDWENATGFVLEEAIYERYIRSNVNNYIAIKEGFSKAIKEGISKDEAESTYIKRKGSYIYETNFAKGFQHPIVSKAINEYLIYGTDYREYIQSHCSRGKTNIYDFCISQKIGKQFTCEATKIVDGEVVKIKLQKYNRFYVTYDDNPDGISISKVKTETGANTSIIAKQTVVLFNDYVIKDDYKVNYAFYVKLVEEYLYGRGGRRKNVKRKDEGILNASNSLFSDDDFDKNINPLDFNSATIVNSDNDEFIESNEDYD